MSYPGSRHKELPHTGRHKESSQPGITKRVIHAIRGPKDLPPPTPPKHHRDPNRPYSQRLQRYENTTAKIRDVITESLGKDKLTELFGHPENELEYSTLELMGFFFREFQFEKYGKTDIKVSENGRPEPPQLRILSTREQSWASGMTDDSTAFDQADKPANNIAMLQSQNTETAERIRRRQRKGNQDRDGRDSRIIELEDRNRRWESDYNALHTLQVNTDLALREEIDTLKASYASRWSKRVKDEEERHHDEIEAIEIEKEVLESRVQTLEEEIAEKEDELANKDRDITNKDIQIAKFLKNEDWYQRELRSKDLVLKNEVERLNTEHQEETGRKKDAYDESIRNLKSELREKDRVIEQKDRENREQKKHHDEAVEELKQHHEGVVRDLKKENSNLTKAHKDKVAQLNRAHKEAIVTITADMRQNIADKNAMLFEREGFAAILDRDLKSKFLALKFDVAHLARQAWTQKQRIWTPEVMHEVTTNADRTQEQLLRDRLWWILHDCVFCSPFRMFGEEGRAFEKEWITSFKQDPDYRTGDFTWPKPSLHAEKFRYRTVKECQSALREPASHIDPRARVKKGFKESRDGLVKALTAAMSEATTTDTAIAADIEQLTKKTISVWLEFGNQRCRLMVTMPADKIDSEQEKVRLAKKQQLELNSSPGLVRYGDDEGEDLGNKQTVGSCEEEKVLVS